MKLESIEIEQNLSVWEKIFQERDWGNYPSLPIIRFIARNFFNVQNRKKITILELGSGTGANLWFCAREGFSVIALEGSHTALTKMKNRFCSENLTEFLLDYKCGNYFKTLDEIQNNSLDAIIDAESLYCNSFDISHQIIKKCFDKLKVGGVMISITFAENSWGFDEDEFDYHAVMPTNGPMAYKGFSRYTSKDDIKKLYQLKNNKIERIERQEYYYTEQDVIKEWVIELKKI